MVWMMVAFTFGAAIIAALSVGLVILGLQWFTKYPFDGAGERILNRSACNDRTVILGSKPSRAMSTFH